ncbi:macrocin-O-methyltransferase domain protein [Calothrix sp. NIES-4071]|nr:macrocin-O-methyltransferase domain protein [Calothrix sp. NIES-4071]BAZ56060.1 macrocin-O-methyltransferase domain protein [Calothrix sp. NIES-4105]
MQFYEQNYCDSSFEHQIEEILKKVRPYSMVPDSGIRFLIRAVKYVIDNNIDGDFVECGVWQGGCSAAMQLTQLLLHSTQRLLHMFDSYQGLPPVQSIDGPMANQWQSDVNGPIYYDNCTASLELVQQNFQQLGILNDNVKFYQGWFEDTIPYFVKDNPNLKIAVLRLDGDWYTSTKVCIENLYPIVSDKGVIIIDDYYAWDGCALAIHEFLAEHKLNHRIRSIPDFSSAYFIKQNWREE